jgi:hypothetical protein
MEISLKEAVQRVSKVPTELKEDPWSGVIWNTQKHIMMANSDTQRTGSQLLYYGCGGDLSKFKPQSNLEHLKKDLAALKNIAFSDVKIEKWIK